jgi:predicted dehydrogenase
MKKKSFLIIGYGSSGKRFVNIIKKLKIYKKIYIYTKQNCPFLKIKNLNEIKNKKIDFAIICSKTALHFKHLKFIDQNKKNLTILIEKPLYSKNINYKPKNKGKAYSAAILHNLALKRPSISPGILVSLLR